MPWASVDDFWLMFCLNPLIVQSKRYSAFHQWYRRFWHQWYWCFWLQIHWSYLSRRGRSEAEIGPVPSLYPLEQRYLCCFIHCNCEEGFPAISLTPKKLLVLKDHLKTNRKSLHIYHLIGFKINGIKRWNLSFLSTLSLKFQQNMSAYTFEGLFLAIESTCDKHVLVYLMFEYFNHLILV